MKQPRGKHREYRQKQYAVQQVRDSVAGSDAIKRRGEMYLPMPSGMSVLPPTPTVSTPQTNTTQYNSQLPLTDAPWYHPNPAYRAYTQRAKFPDMTANTLRGLVGVATRRDPEVKLPASVAYLETVATITGNSIYQLFKAAISEVFQAGRHALVLDVRSDNTLYIAQYAHETYTYWTEEVVNGKKLQTYAQFETCEFDDEGNEVRTALCYSLETTDESPETRICVVYRFIDGKPDEAKPMIVLTVQGKPLPFLPIVTIGAEDNTPCPDTLPLLGVSDCAVDIYRHSADLNQSQFMACNSTLVFIGVDKEDAPRAVGSTVAMALSDPQADAKYITADSAALEHMNTYIKDVQAEAAAYGAQILGPTKRAAESAEALALRQAASGATLVTIVTNVGEGIKDILELASLATGGGGAATFEPNLDFAELSMTAQEMTALMGMWQSGGVSHLTLLDNMSAAGKLGGRTVEEELDQIERETPDGNTGDPGTGEGDPGTGEGGEGDGSID